MHFPKARNWERSVKFDIKGKEDVAVHEDWKAERGLDQAHPTADPNACQLNEWWDPTNGMWLGTGMGYGERNGDGRMADSYTYANGDGGCDFCGFGEGDYAHEGDGGEYPKGYWELD